MIGRSSLARQHGGYVRHPTNIGYFFPGDLSNLSNQRLQCKKWTWRDNKLEFQSYFRSKPTQSVCRKRMNDIWEEFARSKTRQRLHDLARMIKARLVLISVINQQINRETCQLDHNIVTEAWNIENQNPPTESKYKVVVIETLHNQTRRKKHQHKKKIDM